MIAEQAGKHGTLEYSVQSSAVQDNSPKKQSQVAECRATLPVHRTLSLCRIVGVQAVLTSQSRYMSEITASTRPNVKKGFLHPGRAQAMRCSSVSRGAAIIPANLHPGHHELMIWCRNTLCPEY